MLLLEINFILSYLILHRGRPSDFKSSLALVTLSAWHDAVRCREMSQIKSPRAMPSQTRIIYIAAAENKSITAAAITLVPSATNTPGIGCARITELLHNPTRNWKLPCSNSTPTFGRKTS